MTSAPCPSFTHSLRAHWLAGVAFALLCACGTSDADRIDEFVKAVTGEVSTERIDRVLASYVDLEQQPLDVNVLGDLRGYDPAQRARLGQEAHSRLGFLVGKRLNVLRKQIAIDGTNARVELQLFGRDGMGNLRFALAKHGERWLISRLDVGH